GQGVGPDVSADDDGGEVHRPWVRCILWHAGQCSDAGPGICSTLPAAVPTLEGWITTRLTPVPSPSPPPRPPRVRRWPPSSSPSISAARPPLPTCAGPAPRRAPAPSR